MTQVVKNHDEDEASYEVGTQEHTYFLTTNVDLLLGVRHIEGPYVFGTLFSGLKF